jgi:hypothetical protein
LSFLYQYAPKYQNPPVVCVAPHHPNAVVGELPDRLLRRRAIRVLKPYPSNIVKLLLVLDQRLERSFGLCRSKLLEVKQPCVKAAAEGFIQIFQLLEKVASFPVLIFTDRIGLPAFSVWWWLVRVLNRD